jgi:hypothetical protein
VLGDVVKLADRRFLLNAFLPCAVFLLALAGLVGQRVAAARPALSWRSVLTGGTTTAAVVGVLVLAFVCAAFLSAQTATLTGWYEGHWAGPGQLLAAIGRRWHQDRLSGLDPTDPAAYDRMQRDYPPREQPDQVQPTRLGNILRNAELYPADRYGLDAVVVWPRLYPLLPDRMAGAVAAAKADVEFQLITATLAGAFAVAGTVILVATGAPGWAAQACLWGGAGLAYLCYRGALGAARRYGIQVKVAFDLYRAALLRQAGLAGDEPLEPAAEEKAFQSLATWWYRGLAPDLQLPTEPPTEQPAPTPPGAPEPRALALPLRVPAAAAVLVASLLLLITG